MITNLAYFTTLKYPLLSELISVVNILQSLSKLLKINTLKFSIFLVFQQKIVLHKLHCSTRPWSQESLLYKVFVQLLAFLKVANDHGDFGLFQ